VLVPDELAVDLPDVDLVVVQVSDDLGCEGPIEGRELLGKIDFSIHAGGHEG
jgi:hypothetical protein